MYRLNLRKPDGRRLILYSRSPIDKSIRATSPSGEKIEHSPHMRWHPLRGEWVVYATHRQERTFLPPPDYNPLRPTSDPDHPTELPPGEYDVAVFENRFPTFIETAAAAPGVLVPTASAGGVCEVVVYSQDANTSLGSLPLDHVRLLVDVWADRTTELGKRDGIEYVFPFENRGVEIGVTLHHPHGQIYAYPFVPPVMAQELETQRAFYTERGKGLLAEHSRLERQEATRLVYEGRHCLAYVPVCARYAYEVWVIPMREAAFLADLTDEERLDFARALKTVLLKLDGLWKQPMPLIMALHQAPTDGAPHPEAQVHIQIYPALRMPGRLKYLAGSEIGAGVFTADTLPEDKAAELRAVPVDID
ncbi:MAG: galactose-1-phosphate uridylyltransferase [Thermoleophilia bacterium]|nr:galactose-1-phosphate uridylyltransferase [Thermoleophilia bacterium]